MPGFPKKGFFSWFKSDLLKRGILDIPVKSLRMSVPFIVVILLGVSVGFSADVLLHAVLVRNNMETRAELAVDADRRMLDRSVTDTGLPSLKDFVRANPFSAMTRKKEEPVETRVSEAPVAGIDDMVLVGTLPGIGVRIKYMDNELFLLSGQSYGGYRLDEVRSGLAIFSKNEEKYFLPLLFSESSKGNSPNVSRNTSPNRSNNNSGSVARQYEVSAPENGKSGEVPRELVNKLLMNPFDELKKVRLRAKFDNEDPLGMQVQWIAKDSLLKELGVQKGDIVRSVNGIPMTNMGDISNAINSLMGGTNFDVEVLRDGKSVPLTYVVR